MARDFPQIDRLLYPSPLISSKSGFYEMAGDDALVHRLLLRMDAFVAKKTAALGVRYRRQPAETITRDIYTVAEFGRGSVKLATDGEKHPDTDYNHMNAVYGRLLLDDIQEALSLVAADQEI